MLSKRFNLLFLFLVNINLCFANDVSKKIEIRKIESLQSQIIVFDNYYNSYVPLIDISSQKYQSGHLWLDLTKYRGNILEFEASKGLSVFVNGKFFKKYSKFQNEKLLINSFIPFSTDNYVFLSFFHPTSQWPRELSVSVASVTYQIKNADESPVLPIAKNIFNEFIIAGFLIILFLLAIIKILFRKTFYSFYTFLKYLKLDKKSSDDNYLIISVLSKENVIFVIFNSVLMSYSFLIILHTSKIYLSQYNDKNVDYWFLFLIFTLIFLAIYVLKYIGIYLNSLVYKLKNITNVHFFAFVSFWQKIGLILFIFSLFFCTPISLINIEITPYWFNFNMIFIVLALIIYITFQIRYILSFTNVYLFSYLCITEVLPILLLYKIYNTTELILK